MIKNKIVKFRKKVMFKFKTKINSNQMQIIIKQKINPNKYKKMIKINYKINNIQINLLS